MKKIRKGITRGNENRIDEVNIPWSMGNPVMQSMPKKKSKLAQAQVGLPPELIGDATYTQPVPPIEATDAIHLLLGNAVSLYHGDRIKVLFRNKTESAVMYDVYFDENHTILVIKPAEMMVGLVNRNMDSDHFADILEDIEQIQLDEADRTLGKELINIGKSELKPDLSHFQDEEEDIDIEDDLSQAMDDEGDLGGDPDDDLFLDDDPDADTAEPDMEESPDEGGEDMDKEEDDDEEEFIQKESLQINKEADMKTAKDIAGQFGYTLLNDKLDVESISEYLGEQSLKEFGSFLVKLDEHNYVNVYGMYNTGYNPNAVVIPIMENGKMVYVKDSRRKASMLESLTVGEMVKIDLSKVKGDYAKQVHGMVRRNKGFAIIESLEGDLVRISENKNRAKIVGGVPINRDAIVKLETLKDTCVVYEDVNLNEDLNQLITEKKEIDDVYKNKQNRWDSVVISEDIMNAGFVKHQVEIVESKYEVIVGNIGTVYSGDNRNKAEKDYKDYVAQSKGGKGRAGGEDVILLIDGEPEKEYIAEGKK